MLFLGFCSAWANEAKVGTQEYATIGEAISNWADGTTLTLLSDCSYEIDDTYTISDTRTLDLNGQKLTWTMTKGYVKKTSCYLINLSNGNLTITDGTADKKGELEFVTNNFDYGYFYAINMTTDTGTFTMDAGTLAFNPYIASKTPSSVYILNVSGSDETVVSLSDCNFELRGSSNSAAYLGYCSIDKLENVKVSRNSECTKYTSLRGFYLTSVASDVNISNLNVDFSNAPSNSYTYPLYLYNVKKKVNLSNDTLKWNDEYQKGYPIYASSCSSISITSGTYVGKLYGMTSGGISGGQFSVQPNASCAATGCIFQYNDETEYYDVVPGTYIASVSNVGYTNETDLWNACSTTAGTYTTVTIYPGFDFTIPNDKYVKLWEKSTFQKNGNITNNGNLKIESYQWSHGTFTNNGVLNLSPVKMDTAVVIVNNATMNITGGTFKDDITITTNASATTTVTGGTFSENAYNQIESNIPEGYAAYEKDGLYTVIADANIAATVNGYPYTSLTSAMSAATTAGGADVVLQKDITQSSTIYVASYSPCTIDMNNHNISFTNSKYFDMSASTSKDISLTIKGKGTVTAQGQQVFYLQGNRTANSGKHLYLNVEKDVTCVCTGLCVAGIRYYSTSYPYAYGIVINYNGTAVAAGYAFTINGTVQATEGDVPVINIGSTAVIGNGTTDMDGIYAAGYGIWNVEGTINAKTGIYVKAGTVNLNGATINATGESVDPEPEGSGYISTGDGIVMDSKAGYAGTMVLDIEDNTTITSENGYAIHEALTDMNETSTIALVITDGTFAGDKGAVNYSDAFRQALIDGSSSETWTLNGITGGNFSSNPLACADNYVAVESATGFTVKPATEAPQPGEKVYIASQTTVMNQTVPENTEIIVQTGATYTVGNVLNVTADLSKVTVQPGGTLIAGSIVSDSTHQFVVESDLTYGTGIVKYDNVSTVESPKGSVQLAVSARNLDSSHNLWQHFGIPTTGTPTITKTVQTSYVEWNPASGWEFDGGSSRLTAPFVAHGVTVNSDTVGCVITYSGNLVTNNDAEFSLPELGYNFIANSYTAPISAKVLVNSYDDLLSSKATDGAIWVYTPLTRSYVQYNKASFLLGDDVDLPSMQGFFLQNKTEDEQEFTLNYNAAVITKSTSDIKDAAAVAGGKITLSDGDETAKLLIIESDDYSDSFEAGYDAEQMETGNIQIYALSGEYKLASIATNSIDGKIIEIKTKANTAYTLTFSNLQNGGFSLTDISGEQEKEVEIEEGGTYNFTAPANTTVQYFRLGEGTLAAEEADASELNFWVNENTLYVAGAESDIVVYNAAGVKVAAAKADGNAIQAVNIASLANGLYIVESGALTGKFIK